MTHLYFFFFLNSVHSVQIHSVVFWCFVKHFALSDSYSTACFFLFSTCYSHETFTAKGDLNDTQDVRKAV